jgi:HEAT repeat protein
MALHATLLRADAEDVRELDRALRHGAFGWEVEEAAFSRIERPEAFTPALLALLTCHRSGYVRERAVRAVDGRSSEVSWPFLLLRANDWVRQVREAAEAALLSRLPSISAATLIRHLPLLDFLRRAGRANHGALVEEVLTRVRGPEVRLALEGALETLPLRARREAYPLLAATGRDEARRLVRRGLGEEDPVVQRWVAGQVSSLFDGEERLRLLESMRQSRAGFVRREAYVGLAQHAPADLAAARTREALFDRSASVREYARYRLGLEGLPELYRAALAAGPVTRSLVAGLGETGGPEDVPRLLPLLSHPHAGVRREAVRVVSLLGDAAVQPQLLHAFDDTSPGVARAATDGLERWPTKLSAEWVRARLLDAAARPGLATRLLRLLPRMEALCLLLELVGSPSVELRGRMLAELDAWTKAGYRTFARTTPAEVAAARDALAGAAPHLPAHLSQLLAFILRTPGG